MYSFYHVLIFMAKLRFKNVFVKTVYWDYINKFTLMPYFTLPILPINLSLSLVLVTYF